MSVQRIPVCFGCQEDVDMDPIFEAPCGHERCPSVVFHGLCLMRWREIRDEIEERMARLRRAFFEDHTGNEPERS